jgi:hypothetical protein
MTAQWSCSQKSMLSLPTWILEWWFESHSGCGYMSLLFCVTWPRIYTKCLWMIHCFRCNSESKQVKGYAEIWKRNFISKHIIYLIIHCAELNNLLFQMSHLSRLLCCHRVTGHSVYPHPKWPWHLGCWDWCSCVLWLWHCAHCWGDIATTTIARCFLGRRPSLYRTAPSWGIEYSGPISASCTDRLYSVCSEADPIKSFIAGVWLV